MRIQTENINRWKTGNEIKLNDRKNKDINLEWENMKKKTKTVLILMFLLGLCPPRFGHYLG